MPAHGNAMGNKHPPSPKRPEGATEFTLLPLQGDVCTSTLSQGTALGWYRIAPSGHLLLLGGLVSCFGVSFHLFVPTLNYLILPSGGTEYNTMCRRYAESAYLCRLRFY